MQYICVPHAGNSNCVSALQSTTLKWAQSCIIYWRAADSIFKPNSQFYNDWPFVPVQTNHHSVCVIHIASIELNWIKLPSLVSVMWNSGVTRDLSLGEIENIPHTFHQISSIRLQHSNLCFSTAIHTSEPLSGFLTFWQVILVVDALRFRHLDWLPGTGATTLWDTSPATRQNLGTKYICWFGPYNFPDWHFRGGLHMQLQRHVSLATRAHLRARAIDAVSWCLSSLFSTNIWLYQGQKVRGGELSLPNIGRPAIY